jgi:hypothetical protein
MAFVADDVAVRIQRQLVDVRAVGVAEQRDAAVGRQPPDPFEVAEIDVAPGVGDDAVGRVCGGGGADQRGGQKRDDDCEGAVETHSSYLNCFVEAGEAGSRWSQCRPSTMLRMVPLTRELGEETGGLTFERPAGLDLATVGPSDQPAVGPRTMPFNRPGDRLAGGSGASRRSGRTSSQTADSNASS